ncbi:MULTISPECIES: hypothetical protein [Rhizobium]|uniref:hypothetical protein n=1 Tax=Rhizobium TaxID=379 RepID=UPI001260EF40|nr:MULTISPECIES: hypothetical protein [Rhizobium]MCZ3379013.1 hypothetical protein [Rhizobium sp. AG207R]
MVDHAFLGLADFTGPETQSRYPGLGNLGTAADRTHESRFRSQYASRFFNQDPSKMKDATGRSNSDPTPDACNQPPYDYFVKSHQAAGLLPLSTYLVVYESAKTLR